MLEESKNEQVEQKPRSPPCRAFEPECTIDDFKKVDLAHPKIIKAEKVAGRRQTSAP